MERALDLQLLAEALSGRDGLPSPEELQNRIAKAEVALILRRARVGRRLIKTAWYLHGVASVSSARQRYSLSRQRQAFLVSAHIFDLALARDNLDARERLAMGFAAAIGYRRGGRDPNAAAIVSRLREHLVSGQELPGVGGLDTLALQAGLVFLGFDTGTAFRWFATWRRYFEDLARAAQVPDLATTILGPTQQLVLGAEDSLSFLARGNYSRFERGRARLHSVARDESAPLNERWVAAHLQTFAGEAQAGSPWNPSVLPPTVPASVRQAFAVGSPAVLTFWEPQRELLIGDLSPLDPNVKRMVLAVPTSGGKTLIAQLIAVAHLAQSERSVCFVVPTRSLGREVRRSMSARVRILVKEVASEKPDFPIWWETLPVEVRDESADVEVMTPERLRHLLRHDARSVLDRFSLFVFDEAQLLKEQGRGFVLESLIASLNMLTAETEHRIALLSAAMGNTSAISQWLKTADEPLVQQSEWRGPRRLHAVFNTIADWPNTTIESGAGRSWPYRHTTPLSGQIRVRLANGMTTALTTQGDTGWRLVRKSKDGAEIPDPSVIDQTRNTKNYVIASEMIVALGHAGSVLVVASTKNQAQSLARGIAASLDESSAVAPLVDFARQLLGDAHPLVETLKKGVGFHHAGLPVEVLEALETAVRDDTLLYLTCTSTLTDGVNLPVRTVVLYDTPYPGQPEDSRLRGARLVNAMGRAGRAGRETEGWIVLVRAAQPSTRDFADLDPDAEDLEVVSSLITDAALVTVSDFEAATRGGHDALFSAQGAAADFISFVWSMLATAEELNDESISVPEAMVDATLAARQSDAAKARYLALAYATRAVYLGTEPSARRRWSRVGTTVGSAKVIDTLARAVAEGVLREGGGEAVATASVAIALLADATDVLLTLHEAPPWLFRTSTKGEPIAIAPSQLLMDWLSGSSIPELAETYLGAAPEPAWRLEQMVNATTTQFEYYLSWTLGAVVELTNEMLEFASSETRVCPELAGYIRYGVNSPIALRLMSEGLHSRRIANLVATRMPDYEGMNADQLRGGLGSLSIENWREEFAATASEVADLLDFTRQRRRSLLRDLLDTGIATLPVGLIGPLTEGGELLIHADGGSEGLTSLAVFDGQRRVATIGSQEHADVQAILDTGFSTELSIDDGPEAELSIRLALEPAGDQLL